MAQSKASGVWFPGFKSYSTSEQCDDMDKLSNTFYASASHCENGIIILPCPMSLGKPNVLVCLKIWEWHLVLSKNSIILSSTK